MIKAIKVWLRKYPTVRRLVHLKDRMLWPVAQIARVSALPKYAGFFRQWKQFKRAGGSAHAIDLFPCLFDRTAKTGIDTHYFYQAIWAYRNIFESRAPTHVDVASDVRFVGMLTAVTEVTFVDIRPLDIQLERYRCAAGSILALPFDDNSVRSLSCLSVAEHIGLGRYGDQIDPDGTRKACRELARVLAPGGSLYFTLPVGKEKTCFNAHRIHGPGKIMEYFADLRLHEFSVVDDGGAYRKNVAPIDYEGAEFANGLFHFKKPDVSAGREVG